MQEIKEGGGGIPPASTADTKAGPSTSYGLPYQDDEEHPSSGDVGSQSLLAHEPLCEAAGDRAAPAWRRLASQFNPLQLRIRRGSRRTANESCFCEKSMGRRRGSRRCMRLVLGVLIVLYVFPRDHTAPQRRLGLLYNPTSDTANGLRTLSLTPANAPSHSGIVQLISLLTHLTPTILPDRLHRILQSWGQPGHIGAGLSHYPTDFSRDVLPLPCHSHNDYWRIVPLYSALEAGCISVEADVWLYDEELYVGHDIASLTRNRTLKSLYIDPLVKILEGQNPLTEFYNGTATKNGVFDTVPSQPLVLLIDFKTEGTALWPHVSSALEPLRERGYLTHRNDTTNPNTITSGPITVVGTGNTPFALVTSDSTNAHHDIFFDAPLDKLSSPSPSPYNSTNSYYASVSFPSSIGHLPTSTFSHKQLSTLRAQISDAHALGLKARYWDLPFWPIGLRNHVWEVLVKEGVDLLNVDDLKGASARDWGKGRGWWRGDV